MTEVNEKCLSVLNVSKKYNGEYVLQDFSIDVNNNDFVVIVGPSGCGKTTLLKIIAGLEKMTQGRILIDNIDISNFEPKDRDVSMVFQNYALYPHLSVYGNLAFPLKMHKKYDSNKKRNVNYSREEIERIVIATAQKLGIYDLLNRKPNELSGGERQRVALGRAIIRNPKVFLLDEPLSNLDAKLKVSMREELVSIFKTLSRPFVYVTHDQVEAMTMGTKIVVMDHGKIQQVGTPNDVFFAPKNLFVAEFLGIPAMNFLKGCIRKSSDYSYLYVDKWQMKIQTDQMVEDGADVIVGFRPEFSVITNGESGNFISGEIIAEESSGSVIDYTIKTEQNEFIKIRVPLFANMSNDNVRFRIGQFVNVVPNHKYISLFDVKTQERIEFNSLI